jgi:thymidylate synthase (FAD)
MADYTIVKPSFTLFEPCTPVNYMKFLELCTRNCYKSEEHIKIGSAEKLLKRVVNDFGHYSVVEHANCIIQVSDPWIVEDLFQEFALHNPLLRMSFRDDAREILLVSGNIRMWKDFLERWPQPGHSKCAIGHGIDECLATQFPFFFDAPYNRPHKSIKLIDCNPVTNDDKLSRSEILRHMTMTGRFVGSRSMSHQLVRHRLAAYSQESQRYCNYGKKGLIVIQPPDVVDDPPRKLLWWEHIVQRCYETYLLLLKEGVPPEDARSVLPNATKTEVIATYTLGIWQHIIEHRGHNPKAQWEIKELCLDAEQQLKQEIPDLF